MVYKDKFKASTTPQHNYNTRSSVNKRKDSLTPLLTHNMNFETPPPIRATCPPTNGRKCFIKNRLLIQGSVTILIAILITWYTQSIQRTFDNIQKQIEANKNEISNLIDDSQSRIDEISSLFKEFKQNQINFKQTIQKSFESEINKIYNDRTGRTDFALESTGGRIVQLLPGTENYDTPKNSLLGISLCEGVMHGPRSIIQTGTSPGECWAFKGSNGGVLIKLVAGIRIDAVSVEHISKTISPSGDSSTAPKDFTVWGLKSIKDRKTLLGQFSYTIHGPLIQTFFLPNHRSEPYEYVELKVLSNHGNPDFTCIYRFRVHGKLNK